MSNVYELCFVACSIGYLLQTAMTLYEKYNNRKLQRQLADIVIPVVTTYLQQQQVPQAVPHVLIGNHGPSTTVAEMLHFAGVAQDSDEE